MRIVIIGAGQIGLATARLLSEEDHDVILIDKDDLALERAAQDLDIAARVGSGTDWKLLEELMEVAPDLFLALTDADEVNLAACTIAKGLGFGQTVARLRSLDYFTPTRLDFGRMFAVDHLVSPDLLAAQEIYKYLLSLGSIRMESYGHGAVQMRTLTVPRKWSKAGKPIQELDIPEGMMVGLIARGSSSSKRPQIIFPHGDDHFEPGDEVTMVGIAEPSEQIHTFFGIGQKRANNVVIAGGGLIGRYLSKQLSERGVAVRLVDCDRIECAKLSEALPKVTVLHHDATDYSFLEAERVDQADVVISATKKEEVNILIALLARQAGCNHVTAVVGNTVMAPMLKNLGVTHVASPLTSAANRILAVAGARTVIATSALYENRAKVVELKVSANSKIVGIPLAELGPQLPREFLFALIQNRGRTLIAHGSRTLCPGDTVIVITAPQHTEQILELF